MTERIHREDLEEEASHTLEEARIIVPGIQALLGFQLVAVFDRAFGEKLDHTRQLLHLGAIFLVATAMALLLTPPAYHRLAEPKEVSRSFLTVSNRLICIALASFMLGVSLDIYIVALAISQSQSISLAVAGALLTVIASLWFVFPLIKGRKTKKRESRFKEEFA